MRHRIRSVTSALAVLVYATVSIVAVYAETLCVGSDGHIGFEGAAGGDDCHGATVENPSCDVMSAPSDLNSCIDIALSGRTVLEGTDSRAFVANQMVLVAWFLVKSHPFDELGSPARAAVFDDRASSARTRTSHRTAILLI
jgi:hypothetical protein